MQKIKPQLLHALNRLRINKINTLDEKKRAIGLPKFSISILFLILKSVLKTTLIHFILTSKKKEYVLNDVLLFAMVAFKMLSTYIRETCV